MTRIKNEALQYYQPRQWKKTKHTATLREIRQEAYDAGRADERHLMRGLLDIEFGRNVPARQTIDRVLK